MDYFFEGKYIPVLDDVDVLVVGGGTAGTVAAIAAARSGGIKVMIVEQFGSLGGTETQALVTPMMNTQINGNP
ncbi:MAG: FAD-dependent oxidoreductase, partial [Thermoanaerobacterium sp.]|nr:FAD-dependent oxidoreductase [Thermoanaerobacterium sp.]